LENSYRNFSESSYYVPDNLDFPLAVPMVEPDEDDYEMHTRTSPRFTGKKPIAKEIVEEVISDSSSETRPRKKMKTQSKANPKKANAKQVCFPCNSSFVVLYFFSH
jgi:hypothetical protein